MPAKKFNFYSMIRSSARRIWSWSPKRKQAIVNARVPGMRPYHVECAECGQVMREGLSPKPYAVDHIVPASEPAALIHDWNDYFKRLDVAPEGMQILCHDCHDKKTKAENLVRKSKRNVKAKRRRASK